MNYSIFFGKGFVLSFQEDKDDLFTSVRARVHSGRGRIRKRGADYVTYALLDTMVDHYFLLLDEMEDIIEKLGIYKFELCTAFLCFFHFE